MRILSTNAIPVIRKDTGVFKVTLESRFTLEPGVTPTLRLRRHGSKQTGGSFTYLGIEGQTLSFQPIKLPPGAYAVKLWLGDCCCKKFDLEYEGCPDIISHSSDKTETNCGDC